VSPDRTIEALRHLRDEIEHGRGIGGETGREIGDGEDLGGRHAADIDEAVAKPLAHPHELLDIAVSVLEADQIGAGLGKPLQGFRREDRIVAVVDHDGDADGPAHRLDMAAQPFLLDVEQVLRQQEDAVGAERANSIAIAVP
jgi:hypothetical protein